MFKNIEESIIDASGCANIVTSVLSVVLSLLLFKNITLIIMLALVIIVPLLIEYLVVIPLAAKHYKSEFFDEDTSDTILPSADNPNVQLLLDKANSLRVEGEDEYTLDDIALMAFVEFEKDFDELSQKEFETLLEEDKLNIYGLARALYPESRCQSYLHYVKGVGYLCGTLIRIAYCSVCLTFILY